MASSKQADDRTNRPARDAGRRGSGAVAVRNAVGYGLLVVAVSVMPFWAAAGAPGGVVAGAGVGMVGVLVLLRVDEVLGGVFGRVTWAPARSVVGYQVVQVVIAAAGASLAGFLGGGFGVVLVVLVVAALIALVAGAEGRRVERGRLVVAASVPAGRRE